MDGRFGFDKVVRAPADAVAGGPPDTLDKEPQKTVLFVYRDNDLFARYVPKLEAFFKRSGCNVVTKVFPQGTSEEGIKAASVETDKADFIFADDTFYGATGGWTGDDQSESLDSDFRYSMQDTFEEMGKESKFDGAFHNVLTEVLKNGTPRPEEVVIVRAKIRDHAFAREEGKRYIWESSEEAVHALEAVIRSVLPEVAIRTVDELDAEIEQQLKLWLVMDRHVEPPARPATAETRDPLEELRKSLKQREDPQAELHAWLDGFKERSSMVFRLPLETMADDLGKFGISILDQKLFEQKLEDRMQPTLDFLMSGKTYKEYYLSN